MKNFKIAIFTFLSICMLSLCVMPTSAAEFENPISPPNPIVQPRWWPGNPNPQPGSEAWFQQNLDYGANSDPTVARKCASDALWGSGLSIGIDSWLAKAAFSIGSFTRTFGIGFLVSYGICIFNN